VEATNLNVPPYDGQLSAAKFRQVLGHFCSGVTIVTSRVGEELAGLTCQSFFSASLDPPLVAFSASKTSTSYPRVRASGAFCINILSAHQELLCRTFGRTRPDKWVGVQWRPGATGSPILDGVHAWIDCRLEAEHNSGDHFITLGRVINLEVNDRKPLIYYKGALTRIAIARGRRP
jgi:3-hydroxy-9,10-secoandrosta-1,3,5(10)-triene-9,17-dione monooxygenase reductase component